MDDPHISVMLNPTADELLRQLHSRSQVPADDFSAFTLFIVKMTSWNVCLPNWRKKENGYVWWFENRYQLPNDRKYNWIHILFIESSPLFPLARLPMRQVVVQKSRPTAWVQKAIKGWPAGYGDRGKLPNCCGKLENLSAKSVIYCRCYNEHPRKIKWLELLNAVMNISEHPNMSTLILFGSPLGAAFLRSLDAQPTHQWRSWCPRMSSMRILLEGRGDGRRPGRLSFCSRKSNLKCGYNETWICSHLSHI